MHRSVPIALGVFTLSALAASSASAATFQCDASALRLTVATTPAQEPITANRGAAACAPQAAGGTLPASPVPITGGAVYARTNLTGTEPLSQVATASAGIGELSVGVPLPALPLPQLPGGDVIALPGIGSVDLGPALAALSAPAPLIALQGLTADASASCQAGTPAVSGASRIGSLSLLGTTLATDEAVDRDFTLDSRAVDPSRIDSAKVLAPAGVDLGALQATLQPVLDTLPHAEVPAGTLRVRTTPGEQTVSGDRLTRSALHVNAELAGAQVLDVVVGQVTVDATGVRCGSIAAAALGLTPTEAGCTTRKLTLIDVVQKGGKVFLQGAADPRRFAGRTVAIRSLWDKRTVARLKVPKSGLFTTYVKLPPASLRHTNAARYRTVTRQVSCGKQSVVARFKPSSNGAFEVRLNAPRTDRVHTFRCRSRVRYSTPFPTLYETFTLPQYVVGS